MAVCCADMALTVRITNWEASSPKNISADQLDKFDQDLNILREFDAGSSCLQAKVGSLRVQKNAQPSSGGQIFIINLPLLCIKASQSF